MQRINAELFQAKAGSGSFGACILISLLSFALLVSIPGIICASEPARTNTTPQKPPRLALIDQSADGGQLGGFLARLNAKLKANGAVQLVERAELQRILDEHRIQLQLDDPQLRDSAIQAGRLAGVNALAFFSIAEPKSAGDNTKSNSADQKSSGSLLVEAHLLETRLGFIVSDNSFELTGSGANLEQTATEQAQHITAQLQRINVETASLHLLRVSEFFDDDISGSLNWLGPAITQTLGQRLALYPGVLLLQRGQAGALRAKRATMDDLSRVVQASEILIEGKYATRWTDRTLVLTTIVKQGDRTFFSCVTESPLDRYAAACDEAAQKIMEKIESAPIQPVMQVEQEAALFEREVQQHFAREDYSRALTAAEGAAALQPDSAKYLLLYQQAWQSKNLPQTANSGDPQTLYPLMEQLYFFAERVCAVDRGELAKEAIYRVMNACDAAISFQSRWKDPVYHAIHQRYILLLRRCLDLAQITFPANSPHTLALRDGLQLYNAYDIDEALALTRERAAEVLDWTNTKLAKPIENRIYYDLIDASQRWHGDPPALNKVRQFLEEIMQRPDESERIQVIIAALYFYGQIQPDSDKMYSVAKAFVPFSAKSRHKILRWMPLQLLLEKEYHADESISEQREYEILQQVLQELLGSGNFDRNDYSCGLLVLRIARLGSKSGNREAAIQLLVSHLPTERNAGAYSSFVQQIRNLGYEVTRPQKSKDFTPVIFAQPPIEHNRNRAERLSPRRMQLAEDGALLVGFSNIQQNKFILAKVDPISGRISSQQKIGFDLTFSATYANESEADLFGPAMTQLNGDVYFGFSNHGLLNFRKNGVIRIWTEKNGLPTNRIRDLQALNGKLYAQTGLIHSDTGFMELEPGESKCDVVFTTRRSPLKPELEGRYLRNFIADPARNVIWLWLSDSKYGVDKKCWLYRFDPQTRKFGELTAKLLPKVIDEVSGMDPVRRMRIDGDWLYLHNSHGAYRLNLRTQADEILYYSYNILEARKWKTDPRIISHSSFFPVKSGLVVIENDQFEYFQESQERSAKIPVDYFSADKQQTLRGRDFVRTPRGLLVLTDNAIYRIANIE